MIEAEVGSLLEVLPVALVVTSSRGAVLRANPTAEALLGSSETLLGRQIDEILSLRPISVRVRMLSHEGQVIRLYVLHAEPRLSLPALWGQPS